MVNKYKGDDVYKPGMKFDLEFSNEDRVSFLRARGKYWRTGTAAAEADEMRGLKERQNYMRSKKKDE
jgi:hypothetical protein